MHLLLPLGVTLLVASDFKVESLKEAAPAEVAETVRKELAPAGTRVLRGGKPFADFWFRSAVPTSEANKSLGVLYPTLRAGGLVGVVRFHADSADFKAWVEWKNKYLPEGNIADANIVFGYVVASVTTQVLKQAGDNLTRANVLAQATNLKDFTVPMLLPGIKINTSKDDYLPIQQMSLMKFDGEKWELFGEIISQ